MLTYNASQIEISLWIMKIYQHVIHQTKADDKDNKGRGQNMTSTYKKNWCSIQLRIDSYEIILFDLFHYNQKLWCQQMQPGPKWGHFGGHVGHTWGQYLSNESNYITCEWSLSELEAFSWWSCLIKVSECILRYIIDKTSLLRSNWRSWRSYWGQIQSSQNICMMYI